MPDTGHVAVGLLAARRFDDDLRKTGVTFSLLSLLPDIDMIGRKLGYDHTMLGHRGLTHSLVFAGLVGLALLAWKGRRFALWAALIVASHGFLDMADVGPNGVAYLWPFSTKFYFWPGALRFLPGPPPGENYLSWAGAYRVGVGTLWFLPVFWLALRAQRRGDVGGDLGLERV